MNCRHVILFRRGMRYARGEKWSLFLLAGLLCGSRLFAGELPADTVVLAGEPTTVALGTVVPPADGSAPVNVLPSVPEPPTTAAPPPLTEERVPDCVQRDDKGNFLGWMDSEHCMLSGRALSTAQWLDGLFGGWYAPEDATGRVRVITTQRWEEGSGFGSTVSIRASAVLPNAKRRLRLVISDEEDSLRPGFLEATGAALQPATSAAIRWRPEFFRKIKYTFDIGLRSTPDIYARVRAIRQWQVGEDTVLRFSDIARYGAQEKHRNVIRLETEHVLNHKTVFQQSNVVQYWEKEPEPVGLRWEQDWIILHRLGLQKSVSYGLLMQGVQRPAWQMDSKSLFLQYRQTVWRPWLFLDVEPHLTRYRSKAWETLPSLILRLEAQFGK